MITYESKDPNELKWTEIKPSIMYSNWCVNHLKEKPAVVIYKGDSLCEECFVNKT